MRIIWTTRAENQRLEIFDYIAEDNPKAAIKLNDHFLKLTGLLLDNPSLGKQGIVPGTRELIAQESYRLVYRVESEIILIVAVMHSAQLWPPLA